MLNLTENDLQILQQRGITPEQLEEQVSRFKTGFPWLKIHDSARPGAGITVLSAQEQADAVQRWKNYIDEGGVVVKFVPASGAASRMFKALFGFVDGTEEHPAEGSDVAKLLAGIHEVAFFNELDATVQRLYNMNVDALLAAGREKDVIAAIIKENGMNYGNLPKGLLTFHHSAEGTRTPLAEQLVEGAQTAKLSNGTVNLHLTVSGAHRKAFEAKVAEIRPAVEAATGAKINVTMSEQQPSTDTVAVNEDNTLFREDGKPVFRPGGHGALIQNLNDIDSEVIFIKNIDNVVPDSFRADTIQYKQVLGGYLMQLTDSIRTYLRDIEAGVAEEPELAEICAFMRKEFSFDAPELDTLHGEELARYLFSKLNRPVRVCGMVKNEGEPGGGPYITYNADGSRSLQILESTQINMDEYKETMQTATHFNPVDLVCNVLDYKGNHFDLPKYVDPSTGFISSKSLHGRSLKALELPGLWNGAMSNWNTAFVEVPVSTFNPVKTVNDLLRPQHKG